MIDLVLAPSKWLDVCRWWLTKDISEVGCHSSCIKLCVYRTSTVITHEHAQKLLVGSSLTTFGYIVQVYLAIGVFHIGVIAVGAKVAPLPNDTITKVAIMSFVTVAMNDNSFDFTTNLTSVPNTGLAIYFGPHFNHASVIDNQRSTEHSAFHHEYILTDIDGTICCIDTLSMHPGTIPNMDAIWRPNDFSILIYMTQNTSLSILKVTLYPDIVKAQYIFWSI